jgi:hypothetical protein
LILRSTLRDLSLPIVDIASNGPTQAICHTVTMKPLLMARLGVEDIVERAGDVLLVGW